MMIIIIIIIDVGGGGLSCSADVYIVDLLYAQVVILGYYITRYLGTSTCSPSFSLWPRPNFNQFPAVHDITPVYYNTTTVDVPCAVAVRFGVHYTGVVFSASAIRFDGTIVNNTHICTGIIYAALALSIRRKRSNKYLYNITYKITYHTHVSRYVIMLWHVNTPKIICTTILHPMYICYENNTITQYLCTITNTVHCTGSGVADFINLWDTIIFIIVIVNTRMNNYAFTWNGNWERMA